MLQHCPASCESILKAQQEGRKTTAASSGDKPKEERCIDKHQHCPQWAKLGECKENMDVRIYCALSCGLCDQEDECTDQHDNCKFWADAGECINVSDSSTQYT